MSAFINNFLVTHVLFIISILRNYWLGISIYVISYKYINFWNFPYVITLTNVFNEISIDFKNNPNLENVIIMLYIIYLRHNIAR